MLIFPQQHTLMKQATLLAAFIAIVSFSVAMPVTANDQYAIRISGDTSMMKYSDVREMLQDIIDITGLQTDIKLKEANVLNIEASISHRKRYISFNPTYIASLNKITRNKWAVMTLLAHEVGHHLNGHTIRKGGSTPELELEADEFAGFILQKLGATLQESQIVMHYISKAKESRTHPAKDSRLHAIEKGWNKAAAAQQVNATAKQ
jgi:hypothetical protein